MPGIPAGRRDLDGGHFASPCPLIVRRPSPASTIRRARRARSGPPPLPRTQGAVGVIQVDLGPHGPRGRVLGDRDPGDLAPEDARAGDLGSERRRIADVDPGHVAIGDGRDDPHAPHPPDDREDRLRHDAGRRADELAFADIAPGDHAIDRRTDPERIHQEPGLVAVDLGDPEPLVDHFAVGPADWYPAWAPWRSAWVTTN